MEKIVVSIKDASVRYNLAMQKRHGLKDYFQALQRRELLFQEFIALKDISLTVRQGESWGIVGKNGSGKSTLLKLITGIQQLGIRYQPLFSSNDLYFSMVAMACAERIAPLPEVLVHYRVGLENNIQSKKSKAPLDVYYAFVAVKEELVRRQLFDEFRKPFAVKAAESMLRNLDTMTSIEGYQHLYQTLHEGGMAYLEVDRISETDMQHIKYGAVKLQRCKDILDRDFESHMLQLLTETRPGESIKAVGMPDLYAQEIGRLQEEIEALRESYAYRIGMKITKPLHRAKMYMKKLEGN